MTAAEVAAVAIEAGLDVTYRLSYGIGPPDTETSSGYSECWCIPPPVGRVVDLGFDSGGRLIIFVDSGQTFTQARGQPRLGWGCEPTGASLATAQVVARPTGVERADAINIRIPIDGAEIGLMAEGA